MKLKLIQQALRALRTPSLVCAALLVELHGEAALAQALPNPNDQPQLTAEPPVRVPATAKCDEVVLMNKFDGFYLPNPKDLDDRGGVRFGEHKASACTGPWSKVVLHVDVSAREGINFDRVFEMYLGNAPLLSSSTSEPVGDGTDVHWQLQADVSDFANALQSDQSITAILNNAHFDGYNGIYYVKMTLSYYAADASHPAIDAPDYIGALYPKDALGRPTNYGLSGYAGFDFNSAEKFVSMQVSDLPKNLVSLFADLRAQGHGPNEEFWWSGGKRQVELFIDGVLAGFAPIYPVLFTGANGPANWMPIPSPRAFHLDPYRVDLTPFIGMLVDGKPHTFELHVPDAVIEDGDYWMVGGTLFGHTDPVLLQTSGALTTMPAAGNAVTESGSVNYAAARTAQWAGYVDTSTGRVQTAVDNQIDITQVSALGLANNNQWDWTTISTTTPAIGEPVTHTETRRYSMLGTLGLAGAVPSALTLGDSGTTVIEGPAPYSSQFSLQMTTSGAGLASNIAQLETYCGSDSKGWSYNRMVTAAAGFVTSDQQDLTTCPRATSSTPSPSPAPAPAPAPTPAPAPSPAPTPSPAPAPAPAPAPTPTPSPAPSPASPSPAPTVMSAAPDGRYGGAMPTGLMLFCLPLAALLRRNGRRSASRQSS